MNDNQVMLAMHIDDTYKVERVLTQGVGGVTELVTITGAGPFIRKKIPSEIARRRVWSALAECSCKRLPHVAATYELPEEFVVVYDFVPGESLERHVQHQGPMGYAEAVRAICELCEAVAALHQLSVIHRDITPANVILSADGAHLIDLGIARLRVEGVTHDTASLGTWGFASPEQFGFAQTDARSDVYSLGRVLGFAMTGIRPDDETFDAALSDRAIVPQPVFDVIQKACAFEPSSRYQSAEELSSALKDAVGKGTGVGVPAVGETESTASVGNGASSPERDASASAAGDPAVAAIAPKSASAGLGSVSKRRILAVCGIAVVAVALGVALFVGAQTQQPQTTSQESSTSQTTGAASGTVSTDSLENALEIVDSGWSVMESGYVTFGVQLRNNETCTIDFPEVKVTGYAKDGSILFSKSSVLSKIGAGQTISFGDQAGNGIALDRVTFEAVVPERGDLNPNEQVATFSVSGLSRSTSSLGNDVLLGKVKTESEEVGGLESSQIRLSAILRNSAGEIVGGCLEFVSMPALGAETSFQINVPSGLVYDTYEVSGICW